MLGMMSFLATVKMPKVLSFHTRKPYETNTPFLTAEPTHSVSGGLVHSLG
jgi:hypothetical protein